MEFQKDNTFFTGRLKSLVFALKGAIKLITTEHSIMVQSTLAVLITIAGFYFNISHEEWLFQTLMLVNEGPVLLEYRYLALMLG
jgi:diacylglycerol kinase (ATP)